MRTGGTLEDMDRERQGATKCRNKVVVHRILVVMA